MSGALSVARRVYAAWLLADKVTIRALTHADATWTFPGDPTIVPWAGQFEGQGITRFVDLVVDLLDYEEIRVERWAELGDRVLIVATERFFVRATGRTCDNRYAALFTVRDGLVVQYEEFSDTAAMERALS